MKKIRKEDLFVNKPLNPKGAYKTKEEAETVIKFLKQELA